MWALWVEGMVCAQAGDQRVFRMAEAQGTREEGGRSWGKGGADMAITALCYLLVCFKSHANPSRGIVFYWGNISSQGELPASLN